jgi:hypothetical protein
MSETPRDQRALWREVSRTFEELGEALRVHLSPDAARTPSDPTADPGPTSWDRAAGSPDRDPAPWADPAAGSPGRPGEGAGATDSDWIAADPDLTPPTRATASTGSDDPWAAATAAETSPPSTGRTPSDARPPTGATTAGPGTGGGAGTPAGGAAGAGTAAADTGGADTGRTGPNGAGTTRGGTGATGTGGAGTAEAGTGGTGTGDTGTGDTGTGGTGTGGATGRERGRFASQADWESARESVRDLGSSARRLATQAGDAARDPHVRDSAQRAARSLGDAIVTTVEDFAADLRTRMRNPRWTDTTHEPERPPVAPIEDPPRDERT